MIGFLSRAIARCNDQGIKCRQMTSDNGPACVSKAFGRAFPDVGLRHNRTRPYAPRTNGNAERFIQTLCKEWAYGMHFLNSAERIRWLPRYLSIANRHRKHSATATAGTHLSSGSWSCSADEPCETQHLERSARNKRRLDRPQTSKLASTLVR